MRVWLIAVALLLVAGCRHDAVQSAKAGQGVTVELLFEHEGVRVYRFFDGNTHYYAVPSSGRSASTFATRQESCGKNCTHTVIDEIATVGR